jgi:general secretion pathway protein L
MRVGEFFEWWRAELAGMLPDAWRRRWARRHDTVRLTLTDDEVRVSRRLNGRLEEFARIDTTLPDARERMAAILGGARLEATRIEVMVPPEKLLTKQVHLPIAAEENLRQVLGFEMQRQTPFRVEQVHFHYKIKARQPQSQQIAVQLCVVPRPAIDSVLSLLGTREFELVDADGTSELDERIFTFLPGDAVQRPSSSLRRGLLALNTLLLVAVIAIPLVQQQRYLEKLRARLGDVRTAATTASDLQQRIDQQRARAHYLFTQKVGRPASVELLEELSRRLPDDTWLFRLEVRDGKVHLQGSSTAASALIAELEGSSLLEDVRFASPVTQDGASGRERFHLTAVIVAPATPALASRPQSSDT